MDLLFKKIYMHVIPDTRFFPLYLWSTAIYFGPNRVSENYQPTISHDAENQDNITSTKNTP